MAEHKHRCMRCGQEFACRSPGICQADYDVLPNIVTKWPDGRITVDPHCEWSGPATVVGPAAGAGG